MFIEQAFKVRHEGWRYMVGTLIIVFFWMLIGQIPLSIALIARIFQNPDLSSEIPHTTKGLMEAADLSPNLFTFLMLISFAVGMLGIWLVIKYLHQQNWTSLTTARKKIDWKRVFLSFSLIAAFIIIVTVIDYLLNPEDFEVQLKWGPFLILLVMSLILVPLQTSFEEYLFRGYLMQGLGVVTKNRWFPLLVTSLIFGFLHISNPEVSQFGPLIMIYYVGTGLFLGIMTLMDDGMELSLGFHAANNLIQILLVTADWSAFQSESILRDLTEPTGVGKELILSVGILYPIILIFFARRYGWTNWKEKLTGKVVEPASSFSENIP